MTPQHFIGCLNQIGWTQNGLSIRLKVGGTTVRRWANGKAQIPQEVEHWLTKLVDAHRRNPAPELTLYNPANKDTWQ